MTYYVYMLLNYESKRKVSYVGYTSNLKKRIFLHNNSKGAKFTRGRKWKMIYNKTFSTKSEAMRAEIKLKKNVLLRKKIKEKSFYEKMEKNALKYPVHLSKGNSLKYNKLPLKN